MNILVALPQGLSADATVEALMPLLEGMVQVNMQLLRRYRLPPLYETGVRYRLHNYDGFEHFDPCVRVLARGWGDCDNLIYWRCAELRLVGEPATARVMWPTGTRRYHAQLRRGDGSVEDPSYELVRRYGGKVM